jgi:hypothetical protein
MVVAVETLCHQVGDRGEDTDTVIERRRMRRREEKRGEEKRRGKS